MSYFVELAIPANTPDTAPAVQEISLAPGVIRTVEILHPTGCVGLAGVRFKSASTQLWPLNPGGWYIGNGSPIVFHPNLAIVKNGVLVEAQGYNDDDTFAHAVTVMIDVDFGDDTLELLLARLVEAQQGGVMPGR